MAYIINRITIRKCDNGDSLQLSEDPDVYPGKKILSFYNKEEDLDYGGLVLSSDELESLRNHLQNEYILRVENLRFSETLTEEEKKMTYPEKVKSVRHRFNIGLSEAAQFVKKHS